MQFIATTLRVLLGSLTLLIGVWGAFDQSARKVATEGALVELQQEVANGLPSVSSDTVTDRYDGELVFAQGELAPGSVTDPLTGLTIDGVWLKRLVELRQWEEHSRCKTRTGSSTRDCDYWYERVWSWDLIDSDNFAKPLFQESEHVNPKEKPFEEPTFADQTLGLGAWEVDTAYYSAAFARTVVPADALATADMEPNWWADDIYLYNKDYPDTRIRYDYVHAPTGSVSLVAIPQDGRLSLTEELANVPLLVPGDTDVSTIVQTATGQVRDIQRHWIFYTFVGLMLLIRPVARFFSGLNDFTYAPFGKRLVITAGVAAVITAVIGLLLPK